MPSRLTDDPQFIVASTDVEKRALQSLRDAGFWSVLPKEQRRIAERACELVDKKTCEAMMRYVPGAKR